jgi:hypothetical protein
LTPGKRKALRLRLRAFVNSRTKYLGALCFLQAGKVRYAEGSDWLGEVVSLWVN